MLHEKTTGIEIVNEKNGATEKEKRKEIEEKARNWVENIFLGKIGFYSKAIVF